MLEANLFVQLLRTATSKVRGFNAAWGLVAAVAVAGTAARILGHGPSTAVTIGFTLLGVVLVLVILALVKADLLILAKILAWAVVLAVVACIALTLTAIMFEWPCTWVRLLNFPSTRCVRDRGVHITRLVDYVGTGCEAGRRILKESVHDHLQVVGEDTEYTIQAEREALQTQDLQVKYRHGTGGGTGEVVLPFPKWTLDTVTGGQRMTARVPLRDSSADVEYAWVQHPEPGDNDFGISVVSSLPILSFKATVTLPAGATLLGPDTSTVAKAAMFEAFNGTGCQLYQPMSNGSSAWVLDCPRPLHNEVNRRMSYPWVWNVFSGCSSAPSAAPVAFGT